MGILRARRASDLAQQRQLAGEREDTHAIPRLCEALADELGKLRDALEADVQETRES